MMARTPELQARRDRSDLLTALVVGAIACGLLVYDGVHRVAALFSTPGSITVQAPITEQPITAAVGDGVPATTDTVTMIVQDVNAVSVVCLVLGIVLTTGGLVASVALGTVLCRRMLQAKVFDRVNTRLAFVISLILLVAGTAGGMWFPTLGLNGVFAAAGGDFDAPGSLLLESAPMLVGAFAVGVLVIVFRRGAALQHETEGLI